MAALAAIERNIDLRHRVGRKHGQSRAARQALDTLFEFQDGQGAS